MKFRFGSRLLHQVLYISWFGFSDFHSILKEKGWDNIFRLQLSELHVSLNLPFRFSFIFHFLLLSNTVSLMISLY
jgi:hypothetical protein